MSPAWKQRLIRFDTEVYMLDLHARGSLPQDELFTFIDLLSSLPALSGLDVFRERTLTFLADVLRADCGTFFFTDHEASSLDIDSCLSCGFDTSKIIGAYKSYYQHLDPFLQRPLLTIQVSRLSDLFHREKLNPEIAEFLSELGVHHMMGINLFARGDCIGVIGLHRRVGKPDFSNEEKTKAQVLRPHLGSALSKSMALEHARQEKWFLHSFLLELQGSALIIVDRSLNVVFSSPSADHLLPVEGSADAPISRASAPPSLPHPLASLCYRELRSFSARESVDAVATSEVLDWGLGPVRAKVRRISGHFFGERKDYLLLSLEELQRRALRVDQARAASFGLTSREIGIVERIARGLSNAAIASELNISIHTVQNHLRNIFPKVGVGSRTELLSELL